MNLCFVLFYGSWLTVKRRFPLICNVSAFFKPHERVFEKDTKKHVKKDDNFKVEINWTFYFYICRCSFFIVFTSHVDMNYKALFRAFEAKFFVYKIDESCLQFRFSMHVSRLLRRFCYNTHKKVSLKKDSSFYEKETYLSRYYRGCL